MSTSLRDAIATRLQLEPGLSTVELARRTATDESTADYHLRRLRRAGAVVCERAGRELAWYSNGGGFCPVLKRAIPAFRRPTVVALAQALDDQFRNASDLAARAGITVGEVRWAAELLRWAGVAEPSPSGRLRLVDGARVCMGRAMARAGCDQWGRCGPSSRPLLPRENT